MKYSTLAFLLFGIVLFKSAASFAEEKPLKICTESWPPYYALKDDQGEAQGIAVDIAKEIAQRLNRPLSFDIIPFNRCLAGVEKGGYDGIVGVTPYDEGVIVGKNHALFWVMTAYVHSADPIERFTSLDDFNGKTWLKIDTYEYPEEISNFKGWNVMNFRDKSDTQEDDYRGFMMVHHKRADVYLEDYFWAQNALKDKSYAVRALMPPVMVDPQYVGFSEKNKPLAVLWDKNLGRLLAEGTVDKIYKNWTGQTLKEFADKFGVENPAGNVNITTGVTRLGNGV
ncbi:putative ABC transporter, substrate-binding protein, family 3 [Candidatus Terasakiella magnetica]|uniref:Putative ABC transporter, substrate-binding protein, family 3 n=1 Tax=Candidatus Terasakiella magnetica TaxID=1867952 RepID=A0A1C3RL86_9PROT|nr:transporter substrate-binding domain-containing protein [Candidatus Terasakiella magnetica]SCA58017.1 putative ABC transporter, substrate-binding protein, family 3 [Candidatus Terasakiella magnetica]